MAGSYTEGVLTLTAGEALAAYRRVKVESGTTSDPVEVVYADAGEQHIGVTEFAVADTDLVAVRPRTMTGSKFGVAAEAFGRGAVLYGADDGKIADTASGSAIGIALEAATADGDVVEWVDFAVLSTTAATVSVADAAGHTANATVEAVLAELFVHIKSAQQFIPVPLATVLEGDATNVVGYLGAATTPVLDMANGDTDSGLVITWAAEDVTPVLFQVPLPPNLNDAADVVVHFRAKSGGETDTPVISADSYFNEGDTKVEDDSAALSADFAEKTITIAAADVPAGAQTLTVELTPGAHTTDTVVLSSIWVEYTGTVLAA